VGNRKEAGAGAAILNFGFSSGSWKQFNFGFSAPAPLHCAKLSPLETVIGYQPSDKKMEEAAQRLKF